MKSRAVPEEAFDRKPPAGAEAAFDREDHAGSTIVTVPSPPSTVTTSPVLRTVVALEQPTTAGMPNSRATIAAWDRGAPMSVTIAETLWNATVQPILVARVTRISPSLS